ncbi:dihydrofolate reductase family protein [Streptomyces qaidamensis]|uniref:dihydrofolate reductase family protein n=1 Tax=Streptomyces qaidamensis TaxID=1783515 RepID=UPI001F2C7B07|nr:dihydrofolate reductase family protein [Streptomyces qaidamensis]
MSVLTHHPEDAQPTLGVTFPDCDVSEALRIAREAAGDKNVEVFSAAIGRQLLERGLIDVIDLHIAPVLPGAGIRPFDDPGGAPVRLELLTGQDRSAAVDVRYRPTTAGRSPHTPSSTGRRPPAGRRTPRAAPELNRTHVQPLRPSAGLLIVGQP